MTTQIESVASELLHKARSSANGLATAMGARSGSLRQVILAMRAEALLPDHENPGDATLQVLTGEVELGTTSGHTTVRLGSGDLEVIPLERHFVRAVTDAAVIITQRVATDGA